MEYLSLNITTFSPEQSDIVLAMLGDYPFDSFEQEEGVLRAYIPCGEYDGCRDEVEQMLREWGVEHFTTAVIEQQNWNSEWESDFEPVEVVTATDRRIVIRAASHPAPDEGVVDVVVAPRMSFGTGHHITTALMSQAIAEMEGCAERALDMGCGTGVLAIVALRCGVVERVVAVDIDEWACDSCRDSVALSGVDGRVDVRCGSIDVVADEAFNIIFANINRNILCDMMPAFAHQLHSGGRLLMSGFFVEDVEIIAAAAESHSLSVVRRRERDGWAVVECMKM